MKRVAVSFACGALFASAATHAQDGALCADRPTKSNNACTAELGTLQLETDLFSGSFQRSDGVASDTYFITNPTLKYGIAPALDVEGNIVPYEIVRTRDSTGVRTFSGIGDLFLRLKYEAVADGPAQIALIPYLKLPTARGGIGNGAAEAGASLPVNITLSDTWSLGSSPEFDALKDATGGGRHFNTSQTAVLGYTFSGGLTLNAELWGDWNADPAGVTRQYSLDFAAAKLLTKTFQIDGGINIGLSPATPGLQLYAGLATKF